MATLVDELVAVDLDPDCLGIEHSLPNHVKLLVADVSDEGFPEIAGHRSFDRTVCLNVLEHIEDDVGALGVLRECLKPGGRLLLLVPAHPSLYGPMDRMAGHHRRYTRGMLRRRMEAAGLAPVKVRYINPVGGLGWWVNARFGQPSSLSDPSINRQILWFDRYVQPISRILSPLSSRWFGQSLWAVGECL
jgi:SAM-dependent methyltransferase